MQMRRAWKPLVLAAATMIAASSLFYSCKKIDPKELVPRKPVIEDTIMLGKAKFVKIGKREFKVKLPMGDTIKKDTLNCWEKEAPLPSVKSLR